MDGISNDYAIKYLTCINYILKANINLSPWYMLYFMLLLVKYVVSFYLRRSSRAETMWIIIMLEYFSNSILLQILNLYKTMEKKITVKYLAAIYKRTLIENIIQYCLLIYLCSVSLTEHNAFSWSFSETKMINNCL